MRLNLKNQLAREYLEENNINISDLDRVVEDIDGEAYKVKIIDTVVADEELDDNVKSEWMINNPDSVDLDLYVKGSNWNRLRRNPMKIDAFGFVEMLQGLAKRATVGARLLARLKTCPGLKMTKDIFYQQVRFDIDLSEELKE